MLEHEEYLIELLTRIGLTKREAEVYLAILYRGKASAGELLEAVDVHQPQLYNILSSLSRKGFIQVVSGRPKMYIANNPLSVIECLQIELNNVKKTINVFLNKVKKGEEIPSVTITRNTTGLLSNMIDSVKRSKIEVCGELPIYLFDALKEHICNAAEKGVNFYLLIFPRINRELIEYFSSLSQKIFLKVTRRGDFVLLSSDTAMAVYSRRTFFSKGIPRLYNNEIYGYIIKEKDLIWRLLDIYGKSWKGANTVLRWEISSNSYPRTFLNFLLAFMEIEEILKKGFKPKVTVEGKFVESGDPVVIKGVANRTRISERTSTIIVVTDEGTYTIGGFDAEEEDIEAQKIVIEEIIR